MVEQVSKTSLDETVVVNMKHRLTGAVIWLGALIIIVPIWYSNPVNFSAEEALSKAEPTTILAKEPFLLPDTDNAEQKVSKNTLEVNSSEAKSVDSGANKASPVDKAISHASDTQTKQAKSNTKWIIRLVAYRKKEMAEGLKQRLHYDYEAYVKHFPKSNYYSVRVGPYHSQAEAEKDQKSLNRILRIQSELVKVQ